MILYHGSNVIVEHPKLVKQNRFLVLDSVLYNYKSGTGRKFCIKSS